MKETIVYKSTYNVEELHRILLNDFNKKRHWLFNKNDYAGYFISESEFILKSRIDIKLERYYNVLGKIIKEAENTTYIQLIFRHSYMVKWIYLLPLFIFASTWFFCLFNEKYQELEFISKVLTLSFLAFQLIVILIVRYSFLVFYEKLLKMEKTSLTVVDFKPTS